MYNFRLRLIRTLLQKSFQIAVVAPADDYTPLLQHEGCLVVPIDLKSSSTNPLTELKAVYQYYRIYTFLKPSLALHFTPKPNIYGALVARWLNIPCINNIAGLGTAFIRGDWLASITRRLYGLSQRRSQRVFFQNRDDMALFVQSGLVSQGQVDLLPGSGVDLERFSQQSDIRCQTSDAGSQRPDIRDGRSEVGEAVRFLLIARLIWDKGIWEYAEAARIIKKKYLSAEFILLGFTEQNNPAAVPEETVRSWEKEGLLNWVGRQKDVRPFISRADCVVLPSYYREGTPRTLLEAAAMARPLIAADSIGTREPVDDGETGLHCQPQDAEDLAEKMERIITMGSEARQQMGWRGRKKMEREYDEAIVIEKYLQAIRDVLKDRQEENHAK